MRNHFKAILLAALCCVSWYGAAAQEPRRQITGAYTVGHGGNNDQGVRLVAKACASSPCTSFYHISANAASSYGDGYQVRVTNAEPLPTGLNTSRAKFVEFVNCDTTYAGCYVFPQQSLEATVVDGAWVATVKPEKFQTTTNMVLAILPDLSKVGGGYWGYTDGLADNDAGTAVGLPSANDALYFALRTMRAGALLELRPCYGCADYTTIHWATHGDVVGAQGGLGINLNCNAGSLQADPAIQLYFGARLAITGCDIHGGISFNNGATLTLNGDDNKVYPLTSGYTFSCGEGSNFYLNSNRLLIGGGTGVGLASLSSCSITLPTLNQSGNITWTGSGISVGKGGNFGIQGWTTNGLSTTGKKYTQQSSGAIDGVVNLPGSVAGTATIPALVQ